jgi:hypothetical protein
MRRSRPSLAFALAALTCACGSDPVRQQVTDPGAGGQGPVDTPPADSLSVEVSATKPTFVNLAAKAVVAVSDAKTSTDWDLEFVGYDVLTNGGLSGPGLGWAFGPLAISYFAFPDQPVDVPFTITDSAGGTFLRWYAYDGGTNHTLYSRYHVYGLRSGGHLYKLQILGYYGEVAGAPVSALYQVRYAEVTADGSGATQEVHDIDGTLDGATAGPDVPSGCLLLATAETPSLSPNDAAQSLGWDLCFRREGISVNGELGGPGDVAGVDVDAALTADEVLADVKTRTATNQQAHFDAVDETALNGPELEYRGDYATSAFTGKWVDLGVDPPAPNPSIAFLVAAADGKSRFLIAFNSFSDATEKTPGTVHLAIQPLTNQ